jgi:hypothetical protein
LTAGSYSPCHAVQKKLSLTYIDSNSQLGGEHELKTTLTYPHEWVALTDLRTGQIFFAALRHPGYRHSHATNRPYLIVSIAVEKVGDRYETFAIAIIGLESNGGLGRTCYGPNEQAYIKGIKVQSSEVNYNEDGPSPFERYEQDRDAIDYENLYITDWSAPNWTPSPETIVDMTTVLIIEAPRLLCRRAGKLSMQSHDKVSRIFRSMSAETHAAVMTRNTPRIPVPHPQNHTPRPPKTRYRGNVNPQPTSFDPRDQRFFELLPRVQYDSDSELDATGSEIEALEVILQDMPR